MKLSLAILALTAASADAHYTFLGLIWNGIRNGAWEHVRMTKDRFNKSPVQDVTSIDIRCNEDPTRSIAKTLTVSAGTTVGFTSDTISHPGPLQFYLAKVPAGNTAATWDGAGVYWFKIYEENITTANNQLIWPSLGVSEPSVTLPAALPNGEYLLRIEHIALHSAWTLGGAQFYLSCGQINVINGGSGTPGPLVSFPGAYSATDPGIKYDIYGYPPKAYKGPGPAVWNGGSSGSPSSAVASTGTTTTRPGTTVSTAWTTTTTSKAATTTSTTVGGGGAAQYAQCGGIGFTGPTTCVAPFKCVASGQYYSQCV